MVPHNRADNLKQMRHKMAWLRTQVEEYESGRPEFSTENGIVAARRCAEMADKFREQASNLAILIAATEEADA